VVAFVPVAPHDLAVGVQHFQVAAVADHDLFGMEREPGCGEAVPCLADAAQVHAVGFVLGPVQEQTVLLQHEPGAEPVGEHRRDEVEPAGDLTPRPVHEGATVLMVVYQHILAVRGGQALLSQALPDQQAISARHGERRQPDVRAGGVGVPHDLTRSVEQDDVAVVADLQHHNTAACRAGGPQRDTFLIVRDEIAVRLKVTSLTPVPRGFSRQSAGLNALDHHSGWRSWLRKRMRSSKPKCLRVNASLSEVRDCRRRLSPTSNRCPPVIRS
jgi:hypothetical protein